ncbi:hypothetical protein FKM82_012058 [Ascaphus truei]
MDRTSNWPYLSSMLFLKEQMRPALTDSNLDRPSTSTTPQNYTVSVPYVSRPSTPSMSNSRPAGRMRPTMNIFAARLPIFNSRCARFLQKEKKNLPRIFLGPEPALSELA